MKNSTALENNAETRSRIVGKVELKPGPEPGVRSSGSQTDEEFMQALASSPWMSRQAERECRRVLAEISELQSENRWDDINALFHPLEEKLPELCAAGMDSDIRQEVAFSLGRAGRHQDAMKCIMPLVKREPENVMAHYTLAYTALDLLYSARTRRELLTPSRKREMIELAHRHFAMAQELRPDSVTFFYREAMLFKEIEDRHRKAVPLFSRAIANWDRLSDKEKKQRHQQRPKFIRSLYHMASSLLKLGMPARSLEVLERLMEEDRDRNHVSPVFRHFAMGKVLHALGRPAEALDHLETSAFRAEKHEPVEYVHELAARCCLMMGDTDRAIACIEKVSPKRRRPYIKWTHSDVLVAAGRSDEALKIMENTADRDRRTGHVARIRAARIHYSEGRMEEALRHASEAADFCEQTFGNPSNEALFWKASALVGLSSTAEALEILEDLSARHFRYPGMDRLMSIARRRAGQTQKKSGTGKRPAIALVI